MEIQEYLKSLNPKENEKDILIYGKEYKLWKDGKYIGNAIWTEDRNVGDSFQVKRFNEERNIYINAVYVADSWELIVNP